MTTQSKVIIANLVGILVLALGLWGIEVTPEQQTQVIAGLGAIGTIINMALVLFRGQKTLAQDEIQAAIKRGEGGYVRPSLCFALAGSLALAMSLGALPGCTTTPRPMNTIAATSIAIEQAALQIDIAQKEGRISNDREDQLLGDLLNLNQQLRLAASLTGGQQQADLESINAQLIQLRAELAKESGQ